MPQFEAANAQVVGVSADAGATLQAFTKANDIHFPLLADFRRQMLPAYDAMVTDEKSPIYRYARRAYFVLDRQGIIRYIKVPDNSLDLLTPEDVLKAVKDSGAL
jgi:peroxiredoxin